MKLNISRNVSNFRGQSRRARQIVCIASLIAITGAIAHAVDTRPQPIIAPVLVPRIEVAFVLDTTGSMSGLLEGAKQKIWSVVNQMASGTPRPEIRVGLIGYRDRGDAYVTRRFDLTSDIDSIYSELVALQAGGGGDTPESVNQALHEAVQDLSWSDSQGAYQVIFLVGDAPPHRDYQDDVSFRTSVGSARSRGIAVNTIQCGNMAETAAVWQQIAQLGQGQYAAISQSGGMLALETPQDDRLAELARALGDTALAYGSAKDQDEMKRKLRGAADAPVASRSARLAYLHKAGAGLVSGLSDLVEDVDNGMNLAAAAPESLPAPMQAMAPDERRAYVAKKSAERRELQEEIAALTKERDDFVKSEVERRRAAGKADGFDSKVLDTIRSQAAEAGIAYE